jgi:hypothetical protein
MLEISLDIFTSVSIYIYVHYYCTGGYACG